MAAPTLFFDLDYTLLRVNSSFHFGLYLYKKGVIGSASLFNLLSSYLLYKCRFLGISNIHERSFRALLSGRERSEFERYADSFVDENFSRLVNPQIAAILDERRKSGDRIVILSSSPDFIVSSFAKRMGVQRWHATSYRLDNKGRFSSIENVLAGKEKAACVRVITSSSEKAPADATVAYSDSIDDIDFLQSVSRPIAVNPNRAFRKYCLKQGWEII